MTEQSAVRSARERETFDRGAVSHDGDGFFEYRLIRISFKNHRSPCFLRRNKKESSGGSETRHRLVAVQFKIILG